MTASASKWIFVFDGGGRALQLVNAAVAATPDAETFIVYSETNLARAQRVFARHHWDLVVADESSSRDGAETPFIQMLNKRKFTGPVWTISLTESFEGFSTKLGKLAKTKALPVVVIVEDDPFLIMAWSETLADSAEAHVFCDPGELHALLQTRVSWLQEISWCITDYRFPDYQGPLTPEMIATLFTEAGKPVFLCSHGDFKEDVLRLFTQKISKEPHTLAQLRALYPG